ncbi:SGNH/GDSL hydrolase family protein [Brachybacterium sp. UNK5269]|uniref:SGNH/GDSL hydrolase family protein n=1 Tax=Brachybacterium sp. UNK5269 TaxID=3408576 RepID=UPI003BAE8A25
MRTIRLKEIRPGYEDRMTPPAGYLASSNSTLTEGPFRRRGTPDGFLDTAQDRPDANKKLVLLGDSFVESMFIDEHSRFPAIIERGLTDDWRVCNGGYSGMTALHQLGVLSMKIPPLLTPGSKVILFFGMVDVFALSQPGRYWDAHDFVTPILPAPEEVSSPLSIDEVHRGAVRAVLETARAFGMDFGVVSSAYRRPDVRDPAPQSPEAIRRLIQRVTREEAARVSAPFFASQSHVTPDDFYDTLHMNEAGQHRYATAFGEWLRAEMGI